MRHLFKLGFLAVLIYSNAAYAISKPEEFFKNFVELGHNFDPAVASLYSDSAKIHAKRIYPLGLERGMEFTGAQWKQMATTVMPMAKAKNDVSTYSNTIITKQGNGYKIKADRYSALKCYTDRGYYLVIQPESEGQFLIVEEYMETKAFSDC